MQIKRIITITLLGMMLAHCTHYDFSRKVVQQGNLLPDVKIQQLKVGMSKENVALILGTSLLSPTFTNDRWDYAYTWRNRNQSTQVKNLTLYFSGGILNRIEKNTSSH